MLAAFILSVGVIASHPASCPDGKLLSIENIAGERRIRAKMKMKYWQSDGSLGARRPTDEGSSYRLPRSEREGIVFGQSVSRHEFGIDKGVFPSPDGRLMAVYRKDESRVKLYPLVDISLQGGGARMTRYPMCGTASEKIDVCICDTSGNILSTLKVEEFDDERYITGISWSPDSRYVFAQVIDRSQHHCVLNMYRADNGLKVRTLLSEHNDKWIEPLDPVHFIRGSWKFIYRSDNRDGWRNLYLCDTLGRMERLTKVDADVEYLCNDGKWIYYSSAEVSPIENHIFRIRCSGGKAQRLTAEEGWHKAEFNSDCSMFLDLYSSFDNPGTLKLRRADGKVLEEISQASDPLEGYAQCEVTLGTVKAADGITDNYYRLFKPLNFDPTKKYPLIVYVYGGPHSQMVQDRWLGSIRLWEMLMAQQGYVVYVQDNRGTSNRGAEFEKAINRQCGRVEMQDQMAGIAELLKEPWIDKERVGVHGWSYGGFMTISLMTNYPETFKTAVAGGPVIDWRWYEVMYGERYMDTPQTNPEGFENTSLMNKVTDLQGKLLICQGVLDDTVLPYHSLSFVNACIQSGRQVEYFPYPDSQHNMRGKAQVHLYRKITEFFLSKL